MARRRRYRREPEQPSKVVTELLKVPRSRLVDGYDIRRFKSSMEWFVQTFGALYTNLVERAEEMVEVKKRKRTVWTAKRICDEYIGTKACEVVNFYSGGLEQTLLFENLIDEKEVVSVTKVKSGHLDHKYAIYRSRYVERELGVSLDDEQKTLRSSFAVARTKDPKCVLFQKRDKLDHQQISLFAPKKNFDAAVKWFISARRKYSPFRGRVVIIGMEGLSVTKSINRVTWEDIVPREKIKAEFSLIERAITTPETFEDRGLRVKRGVLFAGPPGTGKTVHAEKLVTFAIDNKVPVFVIRGLPHGYNLAMLYKQAQEIGPSIVLLEDIDTIAKDRNEYQTTGDMGVLQELLNILDGTEVMDRVITIATTNMVDRIDRALAARPGRFDAAFIFGYPDSEERIAVYKLHAKELKVNLPAGRAFDTEEGKELLEKEGITHAHIRCVVETVAKNSAISNGKSTLIQLFKDAVKSIENLVNPDQAYTEGLPKMGFQKDKPLRSYFGEPRKPF